jgi:WD40 repeat protein
VVSLYTSSGAVFEKLPAIPRTPTKLRGFYRGTPQQLGSRPIIATTKATGQVLLIKASALYNDKTVRLWEVATGTCRSTLEGYSDYVTAVAFSPDGRLVASASSDNTVRLWEAATGMCRSTLEGHSREVTAVAFSPDGQLVASASSDKTVRLWEATTGMYRSTLEGHVSTVAAVAFSPDGQLVASASYDMTVRLWEAATGTCRSTLEGRFEYISYMAFASDGQVLNTNAGDNPLSPPSIVPLRSGQQTQSANILVQN